VLEELWFHVTSVVGWRRLLLIEITIESALIGTFTLLIWALAFAEGTPHDLKQKFLICLTSVRLSTDSVFGWREGPVSSALETLLLVGSSWLHWLLLNVTSAVIVSRALKPQR